VGLDAAPPFRVSVDTGVAAEGLRLVSALARDRAGNVGSASAPVTVDNTPPAVRIVAPAPGSVVNGPVEVVVEAVDATAGVAQVGLAVNGVSRLVAEAPPYRFQLDLRELALGANVLVAAAVDRAGNRGESPPVSVVVAGVTVEIGEPAVGAQVPAGLVLVRGRVEAGGVEVGVAVNGIPAAVQGTTFAALVPVAPDTTILTAVATTDSGVTASHSVAIMVSGTSAATLLASPQSGVAPLAVAFSLLGAPAGGVSIDFDGNGTIDLTSPTLDGQSFTYIRPGLYFPTANVTDTRGNRFTATTLVQVHDVAALDTLLQGKWRAMKDALRAGDIPTAVTHIVADWRAEYEATFRIIAASLPDIDRVLTAPTLVEVRDGSALYHATRDDAGLIKVFDVRFAIDEDGLWRIEAF
ncbi:MAG: Ig-like domain-containing protein, partial [candidate division NC10 bacterium]